MKMKSTFLSKEPEEDPAKSFHLLKQGDQVTIRWNASFTFIVLMGILVLFNALFIANHARLPYWFIQDSLIISSILAIIFWFATRHRIVVTPNSISYKGGFTAPFGKTILNSDILALYYAYRMGDGADDESEYILFIVLSQTERVRISNRLILSEVKWLQQQVGIHIPGKVKDRYEFPSGFLRFVKQHEFSLALLFSIILGMLAWLGHSEEDIEVTEPTQMVLGWATFLIAASISWYRTKYAEIPIGLSKKITLIILSTLLYSLIYYWKFHT
jgi:hypothetical protein